MGSNFVIILHCWYHDLELIPKRLNQIRALMPNIAIAVISDGVESHCLKDVRSSCSENNALFIDGKRLKTASQGGDWLKRFFQFGVLFDCKWIIKCDPDTTLTKPFADPLHNFDIAADLSVGYIHTGLAFFKTEWVKNVLSSKILDETKYSQEINFSYAKFQTWNVYGYPVTKQQRNERQSSSDMILTDIANRLNAVVVDRNSVGLDAGIHHDPNISKHPKIIGIGLGRTGTTSLAKAMQILGFTSVHCPFEVSAVDHVDFACDGVVVPSIDRILEKHTNTKLIWTVRDKQSWLDSCSRFFATPKSEPLASIRLSLYGDTVFNASTWSDAYDKNVELYNSLSSKFDVLRFSPSSGEGWLELCSWLKRPIPKTPFPHIFDGCL